MKLRNKLIYNKSPCFNVVWVVVFSAKPQDELVLLQDEKQMIPKIQTTINAAFFIDTFFYDLKVHVFYEFS